MSQFVKNKTFTAWVYIYVQVFEWSWWWWWSEGIIMVHNVEMDASLLWWLFLDLKYLGLQLLIAPLHHQCLTVSVCSVLRGQFTMGLIELDGSQAKLVWKTETVEQWQKFYKARYKEIFICRDFILSALQGFISETHQYMLGIFCCQHLSCSLTGKSPISERCPAVLTHWTASLASLVLACSEIKTRSVRPIGHCRHLFIKLSIKLLTRKLFYTQFGLDHSPGKISN